MQIAVTKTTSPGVLPAPETLGFGTIFTDHMFVMDYDKQSGWHNARIIPYGDLSISPAAVGLHYGEAVFEGLKAYRRPDGGVQLFRPMDNLERLNASAERLALPQINKEDVLQAMRQLVALDSRWVPSAAGTSLYIRPLLFASGADLALHGISQARLVIILSPVGSYYAEGLSPVSITIETQDVRAVRGGTGYAKCGGNYAASTRAAEKAAEQGYSQVLWLDGVERKYIEEVGSMNVMFRLGDKVVTPKLTGSVLPGITRRSCLAMLQDWGIEAEERLFSVDELMQAAESGLLKEAWGCGTAAVISPIGKLEYDGKSFVVSQGKIGPVAQRLYDELTGIQWGTRPDPHGWTLRME